MYAVSLIYFWYVNYNVYTVGAEADYLFDTIPSLVILASLSLFIALIIWLFRKKGYLSTFKLVIGSLSIIGILVNALAIYLMYWLIAQ
jgi:hypothetical protein